MDSLTKHFANRVATQNLGVDRLVATQSRGLDASPAPSGPGMTKLCVRIRRMRSNPPVEGGARVWGTSERTTLDNAGLTNVTMARYLDMNDTVLGLTGGHPSDMMPALLGLGEELGASGRQCLSAIVIVYELNCGLRQASDLKQVVLDQSVAAAPGVAGGASHLPGLDPRATENALALTSNIAPLAYIAQVSHSRKRLSAPSSSSSTPFLRDCAEAQETRACLNGEA